MPNWCSNRIVMIGEAEVLSVLRETVSSDESHFDFDKIVPGRPGEGWYEWSIENWGTKWNASDVDLDQGDGELAFTFDTAWGPCGPVVAALASQFPTLRIIHMYAESGMGFGGIVRYEGGEAVETEHAEDSKSVASLSDWHQMAIGYDEDDIDDAEVEDELFDEEEDEDVTTGGAE